MSFTCIGNDKQKHEIGWIRGQRAYVAATTVCDRKMLLVLQVMPKKIPNILGNTEGVFCSGIASVTAKLNLNSFGGSILGGSASFIFIIEGEDLSLQSYGALMMGGADEIDPPNNYSNKLNYLIDYTDMTIVWQVTNLVVNGTIYSNNYISIVNSSNLSFRDDGRGLGVANVVNFLNSIMDDFAELQTSFETSSGSKIFANYNTADSFSITILETSNYHTQDIYYTLTANLITIEDSINGGSIIIWEAA